MTILKSGLVNTRWLLFIPVIGLLAGALFFSVLSAVDVVKGILLRTDEKAVPTILKAVDAALLSAALVIFALGIFELFISRLGEANNNVLGKTLTIGSLDDLKDRLGKIILLVLIVRFFDLVAGLKVDSMLEALIYAAAVLALALSLWFIRGHAGALKETKKETP